jgi:hypothetical protein
VYDLVGCFLSGWGSSVRSFLLCDVVCNVFVCDVFVL